MTPIRITLLQPVQRVVYPGSVEPMSLADETAASVSATIYQVERLYQAAAKTQTTVDHSRRVVKASHAILARVSAQLASARIRPLTDLILIRIAYGAFYAGCVEPNDDPRVRTFVPDARVQWAMHWMTSPVPPPPIAS